MTNKTEQNQRFDVGGQAVMEGVMMRSPTSTAVTVRRPDGTMVTKLTPFIPSRLGSLWAGAVIISRKVGDVWQRSTQRLVWLLDAGDYSTTDIVAAEWMAGTAPIDTVNPRYLNQTEQ